MPIPILKMKGLRKTAGPTTTVDTPRSSASSEGTTSRVMSPRAPIRAPSGGGGGSAAGSSSIPSYLGMKEGRNQPGSRITLGGPSAVTPKPNRNINSGIVKSTSNATRTRTATPSTTQKTNSISSSKTLNSNERIRRSGLPKRTEPTASDYANNNSNANCSVLSNLSSYSSNNGNSNRSSLISNCSSIPPPSSSSSNRNSNSSISSNFSINSWNSNSGGGISESKEPKSYPGAINSGCDTFPRTSSIKRTKLHGTNMAKSMEGSIENRNTNGNSLTRATGRFRRDPQKTIHSTIPQLSSSESALSSQNRTRPSSHSNNSDSNLSNIQSERRDLKSTTCKYAPKTIPSKLKSRAMATVQQIPDDKISDRKHCALTPSSNRRPDNKNVALVSPFVPRQKNKRTDENRNITCGKASSKEVDNKHPIDMLEEDDGYSSVVNTDQPDDEDTNYESSDSKCALDDEEGIMNVEPMKPLEGIHSYSYLQSIRSMTPRRSFPYCNASENEKQRNSVPIEVQSSNWNYADQPSCRPTSLALKKDLTSTEPKKLESMSDNSIIEIAPADSESLNKTFVTKDKKIDKSDTPASLESTFIKESNNYISDSNSDLKTKRYSIPKNGCGNSLDEVTVNFMKCNVSKSSNKEYNWMARNTIGGVGPVSTPNRKFTIVGDVRPQSNCPSLPTLSNVIKLDQKAPESRPVSLDSSRMALSSSYASPFFYRSGSLRSSSSSFMTSTCHDALPSPFLMPPPLNSSPIQSFVRGSPKYSTVIPRTMEEENFSRMEALNSAYVTGVRSNETAYLDTGQLDIPTSGDDLKKLIIMLQEKVFSLTEQVNSSNKLVLAYEHSLTNMTQRLQHLTLLAEKKESEVTNLKKRLEKSCLDSVVESRSGTLPGRLNRGTSVESLSSLASNMSLSSDISSSSLMSTGSYSSYDDDGKEKSSKKRNWFRNSFSKAFKRREKRRKSDAFTNDKNCPKNPFFINEADQSRGYCSLPSSPLPQRFHHRLATDTFADNQIQPKIADSATSSLLEEISRLKKILLEKDSALTESRLENLSSAHQIEALKESVQKLSRELSSSKNSNRFSSLEYDPLPSLDSPSSRRSSDNSLDKTHLKFPVGQSKIDGKKVQVLIENSAEFQRHYTNKSCHSRFSIKNVCVASKTTWGQLDQMVSLAFLDHLKYLDPELKLSLNSESITHYQLGEVTRSPNFDPCPELLPYGYLVGDVDCLKISLRGASLNSVDSLTYETLIAKPHLQRYITLLKENRRIILEGPEGVGKSFLAQKLAEFVVQRLGIEPSSGNIAKFNVNNDSRQDLSAYLSHLSDLCESKSSDLPLVIILESLERVQKLPEVLTSSLRVPHDQCPFIIGTCRHSRGKKSDLMKIHNNFRWISLSPNFEPIRELLNRICSRHLLLCKYTTKQKEALNSLLEWLPRCLDKINTVLSLSSSVAPIGCGVLLPLPESLNDAEIWFHEVWKMRLLPYLQTAAEESSFLPNDLQSWEELTKCLKEELPWSYSKEQSEVSLPCVLSKVQQRQQHAS